MVLGAQPRIDRGATTTSGQLRRGPGPSTEAVVVWSSDSHTAAAAARLLVQAGFTVLRRAPALSAGRLRVDVARHEVRLDGRPIELSPTEFRVLAALAASPGVVLGPGELITAAWGAEYADSVDYYHLRARQYDPGTGRFLSQDPVALPIADPYVASYAYVRNRPLVAVDPSGEFLNLVAAAVGGVVGGVASIAAYGVSVLTTDADWDWGQAGVAGGTGFVAGAVCTATALIACGAANAAASAVQYGLAPGDKSLKGYLVAAGSGAVLAPLVHAPYRPPIIKPHPSQIVQDYVQEAIYAFPGGFTRSFSASYLATGVQSAAAMTGSGYGGYGK